MKHDLRTQNGAMSRRQMLTRCSNGFGSVALLTLLANQRPLVSARASALPPSNPLAPRAPHHPPRAKHVIMLYMDGGPAQMDTFDPKPRLKKEHGKPFGLKMEPTQFNNNGNTFGGYWDFKKYGQSGVEISDLFPNVAKQADELCVIRSMVSEFSEHTNGNYFLHTGLGLSGRPSAGAWVTYGLGSENENLPGFVVLNGGLTPPGGLDCFSNGFLPAAYQGSFFRPTDPPVANIAPRERTQRLQRSKMNLLEALDQTSLKRLGRPGSVESAISNYELAFRMQTAVPELMELDRESASTRKMYGLESTFEHTRTSVVSVCLPGAWWRGGFALLN